MLKNMFSWIIILPCKQNCVQYTTSYTTNTHRLKPWDPGYMKNTDVNWRMKVSDRRDFSAVPIVCPSLGRRHQHVAQCCAKIRPSLRAQTVCLSFIFRNVQKNGLRNQKILHKLKSYMFVIIIIIISSFKVSFKVRSIQICSGAPYIELKLHLRRDNSKMIYYHR